MVNNFCDLDITFMIIGIIFTCFGGTLISIFSTYYNGSYIPDYKIKLIEHNLDSTPIMNILSDNQCLNSDTSNVLGYYIGFDGGFEYYGKSYSEEFREIFCLWDNEDECFNIKAQPDIPYRFYKGKRLCTSKRPKKNYFDYVKSSVDKYSYCSNGKKSCGKLDYNRILCVKDTEDCPINDIVYNNLSEYESNGITYHTIEINDNEYLHYTNKKTDNYIITTLTSLGGSEEGFPCAANDNKRFVSFSQIENNKYCTGDYKDYKYYFYKKLSTFPLKQFYEENEVDLSYLPEYKNRREFGNVTLFSTGFFSLSKEDINNFKSSTNGFDKNNEYNKSMKKSSLICFVSIIVLGFYSVCALCIFIPIGNNLAILIVLSISILITLLIVICGIIEIVMGKLTFELSGYFPKYMNEETKNMKSSSGNAHFWAYLAYLIFQLPYFVVIIIKFKMERKQKIENNQSSTNINYNKMNEFHIGQNQPKYFNLK